MDTPPSGKGAAPSLLHCGFVTDLKTGLAENNSGFGMLLEFSRALKLPQMAFILQSHLAVVLRKTLGRMEKELGWTENTKPSIMPPDMVNHIKKSRSPRGSRRYKTPTETLGTTR